MEKVGLPYTDSDGHKVDWELDEDGNPTGRVTYERCPDVRYEYLSALEAARRILDGKEMKRCYIEALTVNAFKTAEDELNTGHFLAEGSIQIDGAICKGPLLRQPIQCIHCLIGSVSLPRMIFAEGLRLMSADLSNKTSNAILGKTDFNDSIFAKWAEFFETQFCDVALFVEAKFKGNASFSNVIFHNLANFRKAVFYGHAALCRSMVVGHANFREAKFCRRAALWLTTFNGRAVFVQASFGEECSFVDAAFWEGGEFLLGEFAGEADFRGARFAGPANFWKARFAADAIFSGGDSMSMNFSEARFDGLCKMANVGAGNIILCGTAFAEHIFLSASKSGELLPGIDQAMVNPIGGSGKRENVTERIRFLSRWRKSNRGIYSVNFDRVMLQGELLCDFGDISPPKRFPSTPREKAVVQPHRAASWREAHKQYAWLKEQYRKRGAYKDEDEAHWWASECARMNTKTCRPVATLVMVIVTVILVNMALAAVILPKARMKAVPGMGWFVDSIVLIICIYVAALLMSLPRHGFYLVIGRLVFGYGVRPWNVVFTIMVVLSFCAGLFCWAYSTGMIMTDSGSPPFASPFLTGLYFSVITFATVGYGDVRAVGWAAGLAMVEGLLGIALNAALVVVIFRKLIR